MALTARERSALKARAHALEPAVLVGHEGLTDAVLQEIDRALTAHELIKVRAGGDDRESRRALLDAICVRTGAEAVQHVGKVLVLWRPNPEDESAD
jgi:RNA-binding protein